MTGPQQSMQAAAEHDARRRRHELAAAAAAVSEPGPETETETDDAPRSVVDVQVDAEGDPMVVLVDGAGRRLTVSEDYLERPDVSTQGDGHRHHVESGWDL